MPSQKSVGTAITIMLCLVMAVVTMSHVEASDTWAPTGSMSTPRGCHTATLLPDGRVLVTGGYSGVFVGSAELYDPGLGTWAPTGSMSTPRGCHTATLLPDGRVLVTGGNNNNSYGWGYLGSAELYDPRLGTWSPTAAMSTARSSHTATLLTDGRVLVSGGSPDFYSSLGSAEIYDPALGTWSSTPSMSTARADHTATLLQDGRVLVSGGRSDRSTRHLGQRRDLRSGAGHLVTDGLDDCGARKAHRHVAVRRPGARQRGFRLLLLRQWRRGLYYSAAQWASAEIYDPVSGTWWETGSMRAWEPGSCRGDPLHHLSTLLSDGRVLVSGGYNATTLAPIWPARKSTIRRTGLGR